MKRVVLRYDDFSERSCAEFEQRLFKRCLELSLPLCVAAVPFVGEVAVTDDNCIPLHPLSRSRVETLEGLNAEGLLEVALHGYCHMGAKPFRNGEFGSHLGGETQLKLIERGRNHLTRLLGITPEIFVPPWNCYTEVTVRALMEAGFPILSGGIARGPHPVGPYYLPGTVESRSVLKVLSFMGKAKCEAIACLMIHDYDAEKWELLSEALHRIASLRDAGKVECATMVSCCRTDRLDETRAAANLSLQRVFRTRRGNLYRAALRGLYWPTETATALAGGTGFFRAMFL